MVAANKMRNGMERKISAGRFCIEPMLIMLGRCVNADASPGFDSEFYVDIRNDLRWVDK